MSGHHRIRLRQAIREAEGYIGLNMPLHALEVVERIREPGTFRAQLLYLQGEALRGLERYPEAIDPLAQATELSPSNYNAWMALGWCYKRTARLDQAIHALEQAAEAAPDEAVVQYNLACYWSLAGGKRRALEYLARALAMDPQYRDMIGDEPDFDPIRSDPDFQAVAGMVA